MKKNLFIILLGLIFTVSCLVYLPVQEEGIPPEEEYYEEPYDDVSRGLDVSYFYDYLSPYGIWIYHRPYGYVWIPRDVPFGWRPYTRGRWIWTDYGWMWRSLIIWGWAPFHYGRWDWDRGLGWFWVPDTVWGPGWVTWRSSNLYIGWAPLPPGVPFVVGVGVRRTAFNIPHSHWVFVDGNYFLDTSLHLHIYPYERNRTIIRYTVHKTNIYVRNNRVVNEGIGIDNVRRITKKQISKYELKDVDKAEVRRIGPGQLEVYRPKIRKSDTAKPKTVVREDEAKARISGERTVIRKTDKRVSDAEREKDLRDAQEREVRILERSQQREKKELEQKLEEKRKVAKTAAEKNRVEKEHKAKLNNLQKSHTKEKAAVKKRHEEEKKKVVKKKDDKKEPEKKKVVKKKKK
ncbi:MAG: hypothetical protein GTO16_07850 [Candidatus Aminicenantes bacterium]|nr:hypothetical protein [Candidatus Aminicenantes bacterium]